ncbi:metallophosphoesterase family protein [Halomonas sp. M20]|uniref:metallophosphoesterase family protein n=1 Tax=Halomonas sp. M20 TaxID=2763264 RepID=UPI001D0B32B7|nr:metallophosphoesterase [Halomonas sp. M20]
MRLIQITDCHLHADPDARSRTGYPLVQLQKVVKRARQLRPDIVLVTGDISQDRTQASYRCAATLFSSFGCPWFWLSGNHDAHDLMNVVHPLQDEIDLGSWRLLLLDSQVEGHPHGELGKKQLETLAERLGKDERRVLLALHHPPITIDSNWMDAIGLKDRDAFWQTLAPYSQVNAVLCGHIHQTLAQRLDNVLVYGCPATSDQFLPGSADFAVDDDALPGFRVIDLEDSRLSTWIERVDI